MSERALANECCITAGGPISLLMGAQARRKFAASARFAPVGWRRATTWTATDYQNPRLCSS